MAIKILPDAFAADTDRRARFEREARLLAALNHPNISAIYAFEDRKGVHALVLELIEGETLAARLAGKDRGQASLPLGEALTIARQIAEALEAAHDRGIVHRDLKPANVILQGLADDVIVKVVDFGVAKAGGSASAHDPTNSPTLTIGGTAERRDSRDCRVHESRTGPRTHHRQEDRHLAFGCVLYEMLTGRKPFAAERSPTRLRPFSSASPTGRPFPRRRRREFVICCSVAWKRTPKTACTISRMPALKSPMRCPNRWRRLPGPE